MCVLILPIIKEGIREGDHHGGGKGGGGTIVEVVCRSLVGRFHHHTSASNM